MIDAYICSQTKKGYMAGPFTQQTCAGVASSRMAVIPKKPLESGV